jgi:glycosyltransferase involved in cell wall biosynthesis
MISFVIPAYNEERLLGRTISSIHDSTRPTGLAYEVLVVNDASTDRTPAIARSLGAEVIDVQLRHIAAVRNAGARRARGEVLIFVDADTVVTPTAVRMALDAVARGAIGGAARGGVD